MAKTDINIIKSWVVRGWKPLVNQIINWLDSFWHKDEKIPVTSVWVTDVQSLSAYLSTLPNSEQLALIAGLLAPEIEQKDSNWNWQLNAGVLWEGVVIEAPNNATITFTSGGRELIFEVVANAPEMHRVDIVNSLNEVFAVSGLPAGTTTFKFYKK